MLGPRSAITGHEQRMGISLEVSSSNYLKFDQTEALSTYAKIFVYFKNKGASQFCTLLF